MRIILDTNVLLSALIRVDSKPYQLVHAWLDGRFELVSGEAQLEELRRVSRYEQVRRYFARAEIGWLINRIRERAFLVKRLPNIDVAHDPGDNYLLAMAMAGEAGYLVTGDKSGLLALERHRGTRLVTCSRWSRRSSSGEGRGAIGDARVRACDRASPWRELATTRA